MGWSWVGLGFIWCLESLRNQASQYSLSTLYVDRKVTCARTSFGTDISVLLKIESMRYRLHGAVHDDTCASPLRLIHVQQHGISVLRACCPQGTTATRRVETTSASGWMQAPWWSRLEQRPRKPLSPSASQRGCRDEVQPLSRNSL